MKNQDFGPRPHFERLSIVCIFTNCDKLEKFGISQCTLTSFSKSGNFYEWQWKRWKVQHPKRGLYTPKILYACFVKRVRTPDQDWKKYNVIGIYFAFGYFTNSNNLLCFTQWAEVFARGKQVCRRLPLSVDTGEENLFHTTGQLLQQANVCEGKPEKIQHKVVMGIKLSLCAYTRMPLNLSAKVNHPYLLPLPKYMKGGKLNYFLQHANCTIGTHLYAFPLSSRIKSLLPLQIEIRSFSKTATKLNLKSKVISTHSKSKVSTYFAFAFGAFNQYITQQMS